METDKIHTIQGELFNWRPREAQGGSLDHADRISSCSREAKVLTQLGLKLIRCVPTLLERATCFTQRLPMSILIVSIGNIPPPEASIVFNQISKQYGPAEMHVC